MSEARPFQSASLHTQDRYEWGQACKQVYIPRLGAINSRLVFGVTIWVVIVRGHLNVSGTKLGMGEK